MQLKKKILKRKGGKMIVEYLNDAMHELTCGNNERAKDFMLEADAYFYGLDEMFELDQEALGLVQDAIDTMGDGNYDRAEMFLQMAKDVMFVPEQGEYEMNLIGEQSLEREMAEMELIELDSDDRIGIAQWELNMRRLQTRYFELIYKNHKKRFGL